MNLAGWGRQRTGGPTYFVEPGDPASRYAEAVAESEPEPTATSCLSCARAARLGSDMDRGMVIFVGSLLTFTSSWLGLVLFPFWQLQGEQPYQKDAADDPYPRPLAGQALAGQKVYQQNGCMYCHSQQVRSEKFGNWWTRTARCGPGRTSSAAGACAGTSPATTSTTARPCSARCAPGRTSPTSAAGTPRRGSTPTRSTRARSTTGASCRRSRSSTRKEVVGERSEKALKLGREWTVDPGYRWRPSEREWDAILARARRLDPRRFLADPAASSIDLARRGKKRLLEFWLTTEEEGYQVVPTAEGGGAGRVPAGARKAEVPLPEAKE